jgi:hypothetical protein
MELIIAVRLEYKICPGEGWTDECGGGERGGVGCKITYVEMAYLWPIDKVRQIPNI